MTTTRSKDLQNDNQTSLVSEQKKDSISVNWSKTVKIVNRNNQMPQPYLLVDEPELTYQGKGYIGSISVAQKTQRLGRLQYSIKKQHALEIDDLYANNTSNKNTGTLLIQAAFVKSMENNCDGKVFLFSGYGSWPFYYKLGFRVSPSRHDNSTGIEQAMEKYLETKPDTLDTNRNAKVANQVWMELPESAIQEYKATLIEQNNTNIDETSKYKTTIEQAMQLIETHKFSLNLGKGRKLACLPNKKLSDGAADAYQLLYNLNNLPIITKQEFDKTARLIHFQLQHKLTEDSSFGFSFFGDRSPTSAQLYKDILTTLGCDIENKQDKRLLHSYGYDRNKETTEAEQEATSIKKKN